ncbi:MAG: ATP-dependent helicase [Candidatus Margulisiibacteriota bacterium]|nr:MAG: RNA helicase [Candidatus Margulisbacteria bacterium GWD2_39_127]OGI04794.1 MAG: RNA helicase [Candidatus Margulisbacteria bacterium GWF2_38_17]OGI05739.1 MAG: RNA helicase [Candidatus Margulisbacteria bacterium GWE2_39_32]PZM83673.1 MAG: ATP-dependent helicase [Candidatus Margulisiibacteriota bacterium]HAR62091.1 RNA helicase [Candidatus Margulisiibacteriota bacterium]
METLEKFRKLGLSEDTLKALKKKGFEEPTPIQEQTIPILLKGEVDIIGQAQTGTGKTAAFGIPIIEKIEEKSKVTQALILVPTRELAIQVAEELNSLKGQKNLQIVPIYGGQSIEEQFRRLKRGVDVIVGTPGRILDHLRRRSMKLDSISYLVLDEADEMLAMGFIEDVEEILKSTSVEKRTLLFSATMPREILDIAKNYMKKYEVIAVRKENMTVDLTDQIYFEVSSSEKFEALCRIIDIEIEFYGLVFCRTKIDVDEIASRLNERGYDADGLHGDISQAQREKILDKFKKKRITILVATDVAARGIDINNLSHVLNYSLPQDPESYVHRIGRTGRAGKQGTAITFVTREEYRRLLFIQKIAKTDIRKEKLPKIEDIIKIKKVRIKNELDNIVKMENFDNYQEMAQELLSEYQSADILAAILKYTFQDELDSKNYNEIREETVDYKGKSRLFVARGKIDGMTPRKLVDFIRQKTNVNDRNIQDVQIFDKFSFITTPFKEAEIILGVFNENKRGQKPLVTRAKDKK